MVNRNNLLQDIAYRIRDYRAGEIAQPSAGHVDRWINQFPAEAQLPLLAELAHVLSKTYADKETVQNFLGSVLAADSVAGKDPAAFWRGVRFLDVQTAGHSQRDMLALLDPILRSRFGYGLADCGADPHTYVYIDDGLYSGGRIGGDLVDWINGPAPNQAKVWVIVMVIHNLGEYFVKKDLKPVIAASGKAIDVQFGCAIRIENRKAYKDVSDVLWPTAIPNDPMTQNYIAGLGAAQVFRTPGNVGGHGFFSTDAQRVLMEQEFLKAGVRIRATCPYLNEYMRPLGSSLMRTMGLGSPFVTYRNIANNTPLVLWAGDPWYPLFPRKTN